MYFCICQSTEHVAMHMQVGMQDLFTELIGAALKPKVLETIPSEYS